MAFSSACKNTTDMPSHHVLETNDDAKTTTQEAFTTVIVLGGSCKSSW